MLEFIWQEALKFYSIIKFLLPAVPTTLKITVVSFLLAILLGTFICILRLSVINFISKIALWYANVIRGIPLLVLIFFIYFGLGKFLHLAQYPAAILAIGICYSAYLGEIFRAGIQAIPKEQFDAGRALGMKNFHIMYYIIIPQAIRIILPPLINEFIACLKDSSLVSVIGLRDLTRAGREYYSREFVVFETWAMVALIYLVLTYLFSKLGLWLEKKYKKEKRER
jgi:polar amino acid transport system permease protein